MSRKYKQSGYQEEGPSRERRPTAPRERPEGPRGRGLGAPTATAFRCARCGHGPISGSLAAEAVCGGCGADLHACINCSHFDASARFQCREEIPRRIAKKDVRNECELFRARLTQEFEREADSPRQARTAFDDLFNF